MVVDIDRERLIERMKHYFDPKVSHEEMRRICPRRHDEHGAIQCRGQFAITCASAASCRQNIVPYCYRPFDLRWLYWEPETKLLDRNRSEYFPQVFEGNVWIEARQKQPYGRL